jgi:hypothetical protein
VGLGVSCLPKQNEMLLTGEWRVKVNSEKEAAA